MKKKRIVAILIILCLSAALFSGSAFALEDPSFEARRVLLADMDSGKVLFAHNEHEQVTPASLTKIVTCLVAVEAIENGEVNLDDEVEAQPGCRDGMDEMSSTSGIMPGEKMPLEELLYCAMMQSANEACNIIAHHVSGSVGEFVTRMNERARELGAVESNFVNTNGLTADGHYTTANDLFIITTEAMKHPLFYDLCTTIYHTVPATNFYEERNLTNSNALVNMDSIYGSGYLYQGAAGVKTGYTKAAGYCLVSTVDRNDMHLLLVVMGSNGPLNTGNDNAEYGNFVDSINIYDWAMENFSVYRIVEAADVAAAAKVRLARGNGTVSLHADKDIEVVLPNDLDNYKAELITTVYEDALVAPIEAGDILGEAEIIFNGESYGKVPLVSSSSIELAKLQYIKQQIINTLKKPIVLAVIIILGILLGVYFVLVIRYRRARKKYLEQKRRREEQRRRAARTEESRKQAVTKRAKQTEREATVTMELKTRKPRKNYNNGDDLDDMIEKYRSKH